MGKKTYLDSSSLPDKCNTENESCVTNIESTNQSEVTGVSPKKIKIEPYDFLCGEDDWLADVFALVKISGQISKLCNKNRSKTVISNDLDLFLSHIIKALNEFQSK